jgi:hypothetical protein
MNIFHYITDHFVDELKLKENNEATSKLRGIKNTIKLFFVVNTVTSLYAFYTLFDSLVIAILATALFQFVFVMIYVVLFATIRKAEYLKSSFNKKHPEEVVLNGVAYRASGFILKGPGNKQDIEYVFKNKKGYSNMVIRTLLLLLLGTGPAFFFSMMLHHPFTKEKYASARNKYIEKQILLSQRQTFKLQESKRNELDSLVKQRDFLSNTIDSLKSHSDNNGYYLEDVAWYESKLKLFNEINDKKIALGLAKIQTDSVELVNKENLLRSHYEKADFFMLRSKVIRSHSPFTFVIIMNIYFVLLLLPFYRRYSMLIKRPDLIDDELEAHYRKIISTEYEKLKIALRNSELVKIINELLQNEKVPDHKKEYLRKAIVLAMDPGLYYSDPEFRVNPMKDNRKFIEKDNLAKYIGKQ